MKKPTKTQDTLQQFLSRFRELLPQKSLHVATWFVIFTLAIFFRFYNYHQSLYFIYDQGRDAIKLQQIVAGDITLIGPTSGLPGFFLGPLWYYAGVPGYILSAGSPYGISLWYIFLATLALPAFWLISRVLFPDKVGWQLSLFALLSFVPGSISGATFIWNPLISIPLLAWGLLALIHARTSRFWLFISFVLMGLVLQSEFAYGVFMVPVMWLLVGWIRKQRSVIDFMTAGLGVGLTLVPQALFELKNNWLMTRSLVTGVTSGESAVPLLTVFMRRPMQLVQATQELVLSNIVGGRFFTILLLLIAAVAVWFIWRKSDQLFKESDESQKQEVNFSWQLVSIMALIPYIGFMFWRGNHGFFFPYYITPHFIFILPLIVMGISLLHRLPIVREKLNNMQYFFQFQCPLIVITALLVVAWNHVGGVILRPDNAAGMAVIRAATERSLQHQQADSRRVTTLMGRPMQSSVTTFTPNMLTEQYDFMMQWVAKTNGIPVPHTQVRPEDDLVYVIVEPDREIPEKRFVPWYGNVQTGRVRIRREKIGILTLETWMSQELAALEQTPIYQPTITEQMGW